MKKYGGLDKNPSQSTVTQRNLNGMSQTKRNFAKAEFKVIQPNPQFGVEISHSHNPYSISQSSTNTRGVMNKPSFSRVTQKRGVSVDAPNMKKLNAKSIDLNLEHSHKDSAETDISEESPPSIHLKRKMEKMDKLDKLNKEIKNLSVITGIETEEYNKDKMKAAGCARFLKEKECFPESPSSNGYLNSMRQYNLNKQAIYQQQQYPSKNQLEYLMKRERINAPNQKQSLPSGSTAVGIRGRSFNSTPDKSTKQKGKDIF
jgi:hypothetical protein